MKRKNTPLYLSMKKCGDIEKVFKIEIIESDINYELLDDREVFWIKRFNSMFPNGYNISQGGQSHRTDEERKAMSNRVKSEKNPMFGKCKHLNPFYGKRHTDETRKILSEKAKNRKMKEEAKLKIGKSVKERHMKTGHPFKGKHHSLESKRKISQSLSGRKFTQEHVEKMKENHARKRAVILIDKNTNEHLKSFSSMSMAAEWIRSNTKYHNASSPQISSCCSGKNKTAYGFKWGYLEGVETIPYGSRMEN